MTSFEAKIESKMVDMMGRKEVEEIKKNLDKAEVRQNRIEAELKALSEEGIKMHQKVDNEISELWKTISDTTNPKVCTSR